MASLGAPITGTGYLSKLALTGWSATLATWTTDGRVWWVIDGSTLTIYRNAGDEATDRLCSGTIDALGNVTLSALNTSGITGTARLGEIAEGTGKAIISYATEAALQQRCPQASSFLVSSVWPAGGSPRFEAAFNEARIQLDGLVARQMLGRRVPKWKNQPDMTLLDDPAQLEGVHALLTAYVMQSRASALDHGGREEADGYWTDAKRLLDGIVLNWSNTASAVTAPASFRIARG